MFLLLLQTCNTKYVAMHIIKLRWAGQGYCKPIRPQQSDTGRQAGGY